MYCILSMIVCPSVHFLLAFCCQSLFDLWLFDYRLSYWCLQIFLDCIKNADAVSYDVMNFKLQAIRTLHTMFKVFWVDTFGVRTRNTYANICDRKSRMPSYIIHLYNIQKILFTSSWQKKLSETSPPTTQGLTWYYMTVNNVCSNYIIWLAWPQITKKILCIKMINVIKKSTQNS